MATTDLERLVVQMSLDIRNFERQLARAHGTTVRELTRIERRVQSAQKRVSGLFSQFGRGFVGGFVGGGIAVAGAAIARELTSAISSAARIGDLADKIGISTDALQELQFGAVQANLGFEELSTGLLRFARVTAEARAGQGDLAKVLKANGVELTDDFNANLRIMADLIKNAANEQDALLLTTMAFGRGSDEFLEFLRNGSTGLDKFAQDATDASSKINEAFIRRAQEIDDKWSTVLLRMSTNAKIAALAIVGLLDRITTAQQRMDSAGRISVPTRGRPQLVQVGDLEGRRQFAERPEQRTPTIIQTKEEEEALKDAERAAERLRKERERDAEQFARSIELQEQRTEALQLEISLLGQTTAAQEAARAQLELEQAAKENNIEVTAELRAQIEATAAAYGAAVASYELAAERMAQVAEANEALRDATQGFFKDLLTGKDAVDSLSDALKNLGDRLIDLALNNIFNSLFQTGAGQAQGGLLASLLHTGGRAGGGTTMRRVSPMAFVGAPRMHSGGIAGNEVPAILKRGETVLPPMIGSGKSPSIVMNVVNKVPDVARVRTETGPNGVPQIVIEDVLNKIVSDPRSNFNRIMSTRGAGPATVRR